jgi:hypothetical protein
MGHLKTSLNKGEFIIMPSTLKRTGFILMTDLDPGAGLPDFSWYNIPERGKIYQISIKYTHRRQNIQK